MTTKFKFEAKDASGKVVKGAVTAQSQSDVVADLRRRNLTPIDVTQAGGLSSLFSGSKGPSTKRTKARRSRICSWEQHICAPGI